MARTKGTRSTNTGTSGRKRGSAKVKGKPVKECLREMRGGHSGPAKVNGKPVKEGLREVRAATKAHARKAKTPTGKGRAKYANPSNPTR